MVDHLYVYNGSVEDGHYPCHAVFSCSARRGNQSSQLEDLKLWTQEYLTNLR